MRYSFLSRFLLSAVLVVAGLGSIAFLTKKGRAQTDCANYITSQQGDEPFDGVLQGSSSVTETTGGSLGVDANTISGSSSETYNVGHYRDYSTDETVTVRCDTYEQIG